METLVSRLTSYNKEGIKFPEDLLEKVMLKASEFGLPPHKQIGLLSLSQKARVHDSDDMMKIAQFSVDLFRTEWPECDYAKELTGELHSYWIMDFISSIIEFKLPQCWD